MKMGGVTADTWRLGHRPGLDQLRGLAVIGVFVAHTLYGLPVMWAGAVGVALFFTLSGFLITRLMLEELDGTGRLDLRAFYERRARRLLPVLPLAFALCIVANVMLGQPWQEPLTAALTYTSNFDAVDGSGGSFRHLWSLAVEEHFYLVWPAVVFAVRDRRRLTWIALAVVVLAGAGRAVEAFSDPEYAYRATHLRLDGMLAGALLAMHLHRLSVPRWASRVGWATLGVLCLDIIPQTVAQGWGLSVLTVAACLVIPGAMTARRVPWLAHVGVISYGLYLFHYPITRVVQLYTANDLAVFTVGGALTLGLAELSYRFVESPWRVRRSGGVGVVRAAMQGEVSPALPHASAQGAVVEAKV